MKAVDFSKITAVELKRILDEVVKHSNCPLGSFYDARKGCISLDTYGLVPEAPKIIDIEALFAQPLPSDKIDKKEEDGSIDIDIKTRESLLLLLNQLNKLRNSKTIQTSEASSQETESQSNGNVNKTEEVVGGIDEGEIPIVIQSGGENAMRPVMEIESPDIVVAKQKALKLPSGSVEMKIESDVPNGIELEMGNVMRNVLQNMSVQKAAGNRVVIEPRIVKETFPMKMKLIKNSAKVTKKFNPLKLSLESAGEGSRMRIKSPDIKNLNSELENALASLATEGKLSGGKIALQYGDLFKNDEDKSLETADRESETTARYFETGNNQAFVVAHVPLIKADEHFADDQPVTTNPTPQSTTTTSQQQTSTPKTFKLFPALVDSGKTIVNAKQKILSNFFPGMFDERKLSPNQMKEDASYIANNVPKTEISFESVEGKTLSDSDNDSVTEGMQQLTSSTILNSKEATKIPAEPVEPSRKASEMSVITSFPSVEFTTKSVNKN